MFFIRGVFDGGQGQPHQYNHLMYTKMAFNLLSFILSFIRTDKPFLVVVLFVAVVMFIIMMGLYCVLIYRIRPAWNRPIAPCPDKWTLESSGSCAPNLARDNCGTFSGSEFAAASQTRFDKKTWADKYHILWDGL
jgi:hypothetical protein